MPETPTYMYPNKYHPPALVFDLGGVLLDWNPRHLYRKLFNGDEGAMENFLTEIRFTEWNAQQDRGRPFTTGVAELCAQFPHHADLIRAYHERWEESISGPIQPCVDLLRRLKRAGYPLYALSNWSSETFPLIRPKYAFLDWFETIMISGEVGTVKPDPRIYRLFLHRIGRTANECLFVDDSEANVNVANQLGFETIHYESSEGLARELNVRGLLRHN